MSRRPSTRRSGETYHESPPPLPAQGDPSTPDVTTISKIKLRITRAVAPSSDQEDGEGEASPPPQQQGRVTRRVVNTRPNYREIPVEDMPSPTRPAAPSSTGSSKYFTHAAIHDGGDTRRRRASAASGESGMSAARNGGSRAPPTTGSGSGRRSTRGHPVDEGEYAMTGDVPDADDHEEPSEQYTNPLPESYTTRSGRATRKTVIQETPSEEDDFENTIAPEPEADAVEPLVHDDGGAGSDESQAPRRKLRSRGAGSSVNGIVNGVEDGVEDGHEEDDGVPTRRRLRSRGGGGRTDSTVGTRRDPPPVNPNETAHDRATRAATRSARKRKDEDFVVDEEHSENSSALDELQAELMDLADTSDDQARGRAGKARRPQRSRHDSEGEVEGSQPVERTLRKRKEVNYYVPPPDAVFDMRRASMGGGAPGSTINGYGAMPARRKAPAGSSTLPNNGFLADLSLGTGALGNGDQANMMPDSDSDDDAPGFVKDLRNAAKADLANMALAQGGTGQVGDTAGTTAATVAAGAVGRFDPEAARADADPLGVDLNVTFDQVGGLDDQINQLKEMVALPLLYPELFQQFGITPPRGVLFHGPPGTGKTLLARALAASCSSQSTKIAFFMRKGADCLSKWVGEAERQLRLLFEEARNAQPSIIFFDEIDGLAPVRSAKQDQIHSSLVATLLALMDGMDGRGQVVVIGATNRPDNVDPALRRPGRFDREFYFPLPNKEARKKIISINTRKWEPPLEETFLDELASLTKGYGGADLRALCTEAALNAIQRRYPQVYKSNDRLLLDPSSIQVQARDFMASVRKIVPSSARSTASAAAPLPTHLVPLLDTTLQKARRVLDELLPPKHRMSVLEEAEFEQDDNDGSFAREMLERSFETLRVYRPRLLIHGQRHMGQRLLGSALLHHLEGYHVQSLDIGNLLGNSDGSIENALTRMFVEAKRHQPSVLYIPSILEWSRVLPESAKATFAALIESLTPSEPVLLLALHDGSVEDLVKEDDRIRSWFGYTGEHYVEIESSTLEQRNAFFGTLMEHIQRPPSLFPDGMPRKRRVLEDLPRAAPLPPKPPSAAVVAAQKARDEAVRDILVLRLQGILTDLVKKYRKFSFPAAVLADDYQRKIDALADIVPEKEKEDERGGEENGQSENLPAAGTEADVQSVEQNGHVHAMQLDHQPMPAVIEETPRELVAQTTADGEMQMQAQAMQQLYPSANISDPASEKDKTIAAENAERKRQREAIWKPHYVDFELMQNKLVDKENGYLTTRAFEKDVEKIHENTLRYRGDIGKSNAMVSECRLNIKDHFQDQQIRMDIERMAAREYARREAEREKQTTKPKSNQSSPVRHSARRHGKAPEFDMFALAELKKKKRARAGSREAGDSHTDGEQPDPKRVRIDLDVDMDGNGASIEPVPGDPSAAESLNPTSIAGTSMAEIDPLAGQLEQATPISSNGTPATEPGTDRMETVDEPPQPEAVREPSPAPPTSPPFVVPDLTDLENTLAETTSDFTLEELEQLRAMALSMIWKRRADWDRHDLVRDLQETVEEFVARVKREAGI